MLIDDLVIATTGQPGAGLGALRAAEALGFRTRATPSGQASFFSSVLRSATLTSRLNVLGDSATFVIGIKHRSSSESYSATALAIKEKNLPLYEVDISKPVNMVELVKWIKAFSVDDEAQPLVLGLFGPTTVEAPGIFGASLSLTTTLLLNLLGNEVTSEQAQVGQMLLNPQIAEQLHDSTEVIEQLRPRHRKQTIDSTCVNLGDAA